MRTKTHRSAAMLAAAAAALAAAIWSAPAAAQEEDAPRSIAEINYQPYMNVFRRYATEDEDGLFAFYTDVLGFERLETFGAVHRWNAVEQQQFKMTARVPDRSYVEGGVLDATGLRLLTLFYPDEETITQRFVDAGLPAPRFVPFPDSTRSVARVQDPDGQWLDLVAAPNEGREVWDRVEIGLTVSDLEASTAFYRDFVGLHPLPPEPDPISGVEKTRFVHGATVVSLRQFDGTIPADTGSGGIQYVVSDVALVDRLARQDGVRIDQPLSGVEGYALRTIWLDDPDGITNYFAQVGVSPADD